MKVNDEVAHLRVVHGALRHRLPGLVGLRVVRIHADEVERVEVCELHVVERFELATEHEVEQLLGGPALCVGSRNCPTSNTKSVPASVRLRPIGAIEKIPRPDRPDCCNTVLAIRNAGAPIIVIVVPSEAANDMGISSFDAGILRSRERSKVIGSIIAVVVT